MSVTRKGGFFNNQTKGPQDYLFPAGATPASHLAGFRFEFPTWAEAARDLVARARA